MHTQVTQHSDICSLLCVKRHPALAQNRKTYGFRYMVLFKQGKGHTNQKLPKNPLDLGVFRSIFSCQLLFWWTKQDSAEELTLRCNRLILSLPVIMLFFADQLFKLELDWKGFSKYLYEMFRNTGCNHLNSNGALTFLLDLWRRTKTLQRVAKTQWSFHSTCETDGSCSRTHLSKLTLLIHQTWCYEEQEATKCKYEKQASEFCPADGWL